MADKGHARNLAIYNMSAHSERNGYAADLAAFLRAILGNPRRIGAIAPSGAALVRRMVDAAAIDPDSRVLEVGAGTGVVTRALLAAGVAPRNLHVIELDPRLAARLARALPKVDVIAGDAARAAALLPTDALGRIDAVVSSLPIRAMPQAVKVALTRAFIDVLAPGGHIVQFTYPPGSPLPASTLGLHGEYVGRAWLNLPPAAVWRFTPLGRLHEAAAAPTHAGDALTR